MQDLCRLARTAAATDATILISGETGTGKGIMSKAIHEVSHRITPAWLKLTAPASRPP
jgi:DNA-binding NtrC family response regulator